MSTPIAPLADSTRAAIAAALEVPTAVPSGLESAMLSDDRLYVVLAVVLVIWAGLIFLVTRTDRRLRTLEQMVGSNVAAGSE